MNKKVIIGTLGAIMLLAGVVPIVLTPILLFVFGWVALGFAVILIYYIFNFIGLVGVYTNQRSDVQTKITWTFVEFLMPGFGAYLYYCVARTPKKKLKVYKESSLLENEILKTNFANSKVEFITNGKEKFEKLFNDMENAKLYINIEYFIMADGIILDRLLDIVKRKAKEGVTIRILFDHVGSMRLSNKNVKKLIAAGAKVVEFKKINWFLPSGLDNWRTHNKIVVIDGDIVYFGGMNFADEYASLDPKFPDWVDTHYKGMGDIANSFDALFASQWYIGTREDISSTLRKTQLSFPDSKEFVLHSDSPYEDEPKVFNLIKKKIVEAKKSVKIITPYITIPISLKDAIREAIYNGVNIEIITIGAPDRMVSYWQGAFDAETLTDMGVKIYRYKDKFIHSKLFIFDDEVSLAGTTNMDYRAFFQNFEYMVESKSKPTDTLLNYFNEIKEDSVIDKSSRRDWWIGRYLMYTILRMFKGMF